MGGESMTVVLTTLVGIALTALSESAGLLITSRGTKEQSVSEQYKTLANDTCEG